MTKRKQPAKPVTPFRSCGHCMGGWVRVTRPDNSTALRQCLCLSAWKRSQQTPPEKKVEWPQIPDGKERDYA